MKTFLSGYRASPITNTRNGSSPAKALINRKIWLYVDVKHLSTQNTHPKNTAFESPSWCSKLYLQTKSTSETKGY